MSAEKHNLTSGVLPELLHGSGLRFEILDECASTNLLAKERAAQGEAEGLVIIARRQSAGRGRLGRSFYSPDSSGLYMTLLLRPRLSAKDTALLTTMAAVAAAQGIEELSAQDSKIKWVNDIYLHGRKVCGILAEAGFRADGGVEWAAVGIGVNITPPEEGFPTELEGIAGAVFARGDEPQDARDRLAAGILRRFMAMYRALPDSGHYDEYKRRLMVLDREVTVHSPTGAWTGRALELDRDFRLLVDSGEGRREWLSTGEISVRLR